MTTETTTRVEETTNTVSDITHCFHICQFEKPSMTLPKGAQAICGAVKQTDRQGAGPDRCVVCTDLFPNIHDKICPYCGKV